MTAIQITKNNFTQEIIESNKPVLLDFFASWCGPCQMLSPIIDEIAQENPDIKVAKVNVNDEEELAAKFQVMSIPSLFVLKEGQIVDQFVGVLPKQDILSMVRNS